MAIGPQDAPRHAGQVVRRVLLRRSIAIDPETAQLVADAVQAVLHSGLPCGRHMVDGARPSEGDARNEPGCGRSVQKGKRRGPEPGRNRRGKGNRKEPEARGLDQEDVRPGRSGEAQAKAGGPGPAHVRAISRLLARVVPQFARPAGGQFAALAGAGDAGTAVVILVLPGAVVQ